MATASAETTAATTVATAPEVITAATIVAAAATTEVTTTTSSRHKGVERGAFEVDGLQMLYRRIDDAYTATFQIGEKKGVFLGAFFLRHINASTEWIKMIQIISFYWLWK